MIVVVDGRALTRQTRGIARYLTELLDAMRPLDASVEWRVVHRGRRQVVGAALAKHPALGRADVVWAPAPAPLAVAADVPLVLTVHDRTWEQRPADFTAYELLWHRLARPRRLARRATLVLVPTEAGRRDVVAAWELEAARVRVTPEAPMAPVAPRAPDVEHPYFLFVGAFEPRKGVDVLAEAVSRTGLRVIAVGSGRVPTPGLEVRAGIDDAELSRLYAGALALVAPSRLEGFGLPAVEALAHGTPAIVTDLPEVREATRGLATYVPVDDSQALADAMLAHTEPRSVAPLRVSWEDTARLTLDALREAAG